MRQCARFTPGARNKPPCSPPSPPRPFATFMSRLGLWTQRGDLHREEEMWYENDRWRKEGVYGSRLIIGGAGYPRRDDSLKKTFYGTYYRYDSAKHAVVSMTESGKQRTDFTFDGLLPADARRNMTVVGTKALAGQEVTEYQLGEGQTSRLRFWISRDTGLPVRRNGRHRAAAANRLPGKPPTARTTSSTSRWMNRCSTAAR